MYVGQLKPEAQQKVGWAGPRLHGLNLTPKLASVQHQRAYSHFSRGDASTYNPKGTPLHLSPHESTNNQRLIPSFEFDHYLKMSGQAPAGWEVRQSKSHGMPPLCVARKVLRPFPPWCTTAPAQLQRIAGIVSS